MDEQEHMAQQYHQAQIAAAVQQEERIDAVKSFVTSEKTQAWIFMGVIITTTGFITYHATKTGIKEKMTKVMVEMSEKAIRSNLNINCYVPVLKAITEL